MSHKNAPIGLETVKDEGESDEVAKQLDKLMKELSSDESSSHGLTSGSVSIRSKKV